MLTLLNDAHMRVVMATGDNALTAISVGRECGMIDSEKDVFLGDLSKNRFGKDEIVWQNT